MGCGSRKASSSDIKLQIIPYINGHVTNPPQSRALLADAGAMASEELTALTLFVKLHPT